MPRKKKEEPQEPAYEFKIESGIPIPPKKSQKGRKFLRWPFGTMQVGESVFVPSEIASLPQIMSAYDAVRRRAKTDVSFGHREVEGGVRVWRTT